METMRTDTRFILQRLTNSSSCQPLPSYLKQSPKTRQIMSQYYANVSKQEIRALSDVYKMDSQLFDYETPLSLL